MPPADAAEEEDRQEVQARNGEARDHCGAVDEGREAEDRADQRQPVLDRAERAQENDVGRARQRAAKARQMAERDLLEPRSHDEKHADEPAEQGEPPAHRDAFAQDHPREQRGDERQKEDERVGLGQRQRGEGDDRADAAEGAAGGPQRDEAGPLRAGDRAPGDVRALRQEAEDERDQGDGEADLEDRHLVPERLGGGVRAGIGEVGEEREKDSGLHGTDDEAGL